MLIILEHVLDKCHRVDELRHVKLEADDELVVLGLELLVVGFEATFLVEMLRCSRPVISACLLVG